VKIQQEKCIMRLCIPYKIEKEDERKVEWLDGDTKSNEGISAYHSSRCFGTGELRTRQSWLVRVFHILTWPSLPLENKYVPQSLCLIEHCKLLSALFKYLFTILFIRKSQTYTLKNKNKLLL